MFGYYCDHFELPLPEQHRFPMSKYRLLREAVERERLATLQVPVAASDEEILRAHTSEYLDCVVHGTLPRQAVRRIGFPWSLELVERSRRSVGGTLAAARTALTEGVAVNLAGGTHHAFPDRGEGFCVFNDVAVAARALQAEGQIEKAIVIDCDVHQGNGTAAIFRDDDSVFTLSLHGRRNFPFRKETSDLDVEFEDGTDDNSYLDALKRSLESSLTGFAADIAFYVAGADPYRDDRLGRLALSRRGLSERDAVVFEQCKALDLPVAVVMAGGYATEVEQIVSIHLETIRRATSLQRTAVRRVPT